MNNPSSNSNDAGQIAEAYQFELNAVQNKVGAGLADLEYLLALLLQQNPSRHQVQGLLEQASVRLGRLRETHLDLASKTGDTEPGKLIKLAAEALSAAGELSFADAEQAYEQVYRHAIDDENLVELAAAIRAQQALLAAASTDFRHAAALYAEAAALVEANPQIYAEYLARQAGVLGDLGREFIDMDALQAAVGLYRDSIVALVSEQERPAEWARVQDQLGNLLGILGQRQRGTRTLEEAIEAFQNALTYRHPDTMPGEWASTQNNLGNALGILGQRQHDEALQEMSLAAFEAALQVRNSEQDPADWATTQNNLAAVLQSLGRQKKDAKMLKRSVEAYRAVLKVWTRDKGPLVWGTTMSNLGTALRLLGEHRKGPRTLEQSVAAYNAALSVQTRDLVPQVWAMTQNNLGAALQVLAERADDSLALGKAVAAYRETLKEWTREKEPMSWAMTMANVGVARRKLAESNQDVDISRKAEADLKHAVDVFRGASHAKLTELGEEQLSLARKLTASLQKDSPG